MRANDILSLTAFTAKMSNHEITFNTNLSDPTRTRADFTYKITPTLISITDTGLGQRFLFWIGPTSRPISSLW